MVPGWWHIECSVPITQPTSVSTGLSLLGFEVGSESSKAPVGPLSPQGAHTVMPSHQSLAGSL